MRIYPRVSVIPPLCTSPARQAASHHTSTSSLSLWTGAASLLPGPHSQYLGYSQQANTATLAESRHTADMDKP